MNLNPSYVTRSEIFSKPIISTAFEFSFAFAGLVSIKNAPFIGNLVFNKIGSVNLKKEIVVNVQYEDNYYSIENDKLNIFVNSETIEGLKKEFEEYFLVIIDEIVLEKTENLTQDAIHLRETFLEYIEG